MLSGPLYPDGIEILPESEIETLIKDRNVDEVVFAYSDVNWDYIAEKRAMVEATGAAFSLFEADPR